MKKSFLFLIFWLGFVLNLGHAGANPQDSKMAVSLIQETISTNECSGQSSRPFKTYSVFGLGTDGRFYGVKSEQMMPIEIPPQEAEIQVGPQPEGKDQSIAVFYFDLIKAKTAIAAFKISKGINEEVCPLRLEASNGTTGPSVEVPSQPRPPKKEKPNRYPPGRGGSDCDVAGKADSYVLAMSWQPAFCEKKREKPECSKPEFLTDDQYQANNFTLHGLWPNKKDCGINYGFCSEVKKKSSFGAYEPLQLTTQTAEVLGKVMPSVRAESHLERHEWYKHGTCQAMNANDYFTYASALVEEFNSLPVVTELVRKAKGQKVKKADFMQAIDQSLGAGLSQNFVLVCKDNMLVEVNIPLKKDLPINPKLADLINTEEAGWVRGCRDEFIIDKP